MRKVKRLGTGQHITEEQIRLLDSVGFDWDPLMTAWNIGFQKLLQYKAERGHCLVEVKRCMIEGLGVWVVAQRKNKKNLSQEQISCLDEIGFEWDADVAYRKRNNIKNINMSDDPEKGSVV